MAEFPQSGVGAYEFKQIVGTRCRLQRHQDLKFFSGWVEAYKDDAVVVVAKDTSPMSLGERYRFEAAADRATVGFDAVLVSKDPRILRMQPDSKVHVNTPGQEPRYRVEGMTMVMQGLDGESEGEVVDISMSGAGLLSFDTVQRFAKVRVVIRYSANMIECTGHVRYCRPNPDLKGTYRIGLQLDFEDRLAKAMWSRIVLGNNPMFEEAA